GSSASKAGGRRITSGVWNEATVPTSHVSAANHKQTPAAASKKRKALTRPRGAISVLGANSPCGRIMCSRGPSSFWFLQDGELLPAVGTTQNLKQGSLL